MRSISIVFLLCTAHVLQIELTTLFLIESTFDLGPRVFLDSGNEVDPDFALESSPVVRFYKLSLVFVLLIESSSRFC
jgi:hypothetical protein